MSFFSNSSGVFIYGGTFYSASGDVNIQNNQQLAIETSDTTLALEHGTSYNQSIPWEEVYAEADSLSGPVRRIRTLTEADRFLPYDVGARRRLTSLRSPGQYRYPLDTTTAGVNSYPTQLFSTSSSSSMTLLVPDTTDFAKNSGPPSSYPPVDTQTPVILPSLVSENPINNNIHDSGYHTPDWSQPPDPVEEGYHIDSAPSVRDAFGAHSPWESGYAGQREPATRIHNGTFIGGNVNTTVKHGESGINILHRASASEAFHNSADSGAQPRCHPETRIKMQKKLLKWCINSERPSGQAGTESCDTRKPGILWVHGPAGAGKSAIMKTLSQRLEEAGRLGGTFFFKRGHTTRGNAKVLFTTIALQLAVNSLQLRNRISATVEQNPTLVARSIGVQLQELILNPCEGLEGPPWIIIIDGLDECEGENVQQEVLRLIGASAAQRQIPLRFIVASRPEAHIHEVFDGLSFHNMYKAFDVESSFHDVRTYLVSEFARIHREHSTMAMVPLPWPSMEVLESLVHKSSGYFIYASTVINFVDDKYFRPTQRLEVIQNLSGSGSGLLSPFTALDVLYTQILSAVPKNPHLVPILRVVDIFDLLSPKQIDALLGLRPGDTELSLRGLHSVVQLRDGNYQMDQCLYFTHASFSDFLRDPARAGDFYIRDCGGLVELARLVFTELGYSYDDCTKNQTRLSGFDLFYGLDDLLALIEPSQKFVYLLKVFNFDFFEDHFETDVDGIILWIESIQPLPEDLVRVWQDYRFLKDEASPFENVDEAQEWRPMWREITGQVMEQVAQCPLIIHIAAALQWNVWSKITDIRHLLNISWAEVRAALCRLRPLVSEELPMSAVLTLLLQDWAVQQQTTWRAQICSRLAWGSLRVRKLIETGRLPEDLWHLRTCWGQMIRGSPACPELLRSVQEFVLPHISADNLNCTVQQEKECYHVMMWLKSFPEPPVDEIRRWHNLFLREQKASSKRMYYRPENWEELWESWDEEYPEAP